MFFTLIDRASTYPVIYVVANPVRGLLDRKRSEEHIQSFNESVKTKQKQDKNDKKKGTMKHVPEKDRRRALDRESLV